MTRRPRSHQLETESRTALRAAFPSAWTIERIVNDYGVDERVEIFDEAGRATGLVFYVQLKATEAADQRRALQVRVSREHLAYWNALSDPVLLVLWHAPSKVLYWRWAHHHPPFEKLEDVGPDGFIPQSRTVRFTSGGRWNAADASRLVAEVRWLKKVHSGSVHLPVSVCLTSHGRHPLTAMSLDSLSARLSAAADGRLIRWQAGIEQPGHPHVYVGDHYFELRLGRLILSGMRDPEKTASPGDFRDSFPIEIPAMLGLALCVTGSTSAGFELLSRYGPRSQHLHHWSLPGVASLLLQAISKTGRYEIALALIEAWRSSGTPQHLDGARRLALQLYNLHWRLPQPVLSGLEASLEQLEPDGKWRDAPRLSARLLLENGLYDESLAAWQRLMTADGAGETVDESVLAGAAKAAFLAGHFETAAEAYERLLPRRPADVAVRLELARCYLMTGRYRAALEIYETANDPRRAGEIQTARIAMAFIVAVAGDRQERQPGAAEQLSREMRDEDSDEQILERFTASLAADAVSVNTWRQYAVLVFRRAPIANLRSLAVNITAFFAMDDLEWFVIAAVEAWSDRFVPAFALAVEYALECFGERFITSFADAYGAAAEQPRKLIEAIWSLKQEGLALRLELRDATPETGNLPAYWIQGESALPAPPAAAGRGGSAWPEPDLTE